MLIEGIDGVTEIHGGFIFGAPEGAVGSLTEMDGMDEVTDIEGGVTFEPRPEGLTVMDGVSWTEIVGMAGAGAGLKRVEEDWDTLIVGTGGVV